MSYLMKYSDDLIRDNKKELALAVQNSAEEIYNHTLKPFDYMSHIMALLVGNVQSGKTSHMFATICKAADEGFKLFILLTTDNTLLQQQTYKRAENDLQDFCVCSEMDEIKFMQNKMQKPVVIVLKKNGRVLQKWKNNLASTDYCKGNPLIIVDDEADAASLNTKVNQRKISKINSELDGIRKTSSCSIFLQVTGTPQSILLQAERGGFRPQHVYCFEPGDTYLGGDFFFTENPNPYLIITDEEEVKAIEIDDDFPENGLKEALHVHLITSAHLLLTGEDTSNFLVHPSTKTDKHEIFAERIGNYVNELSDHFDDPDSDEDILITEYENLKLTCHDISPYPDVLNKIEELIVNDLVSIHTINSKSEYVPEEEYQTGVNIIVGGNSLGRGITFPMLQTVYYCRTSKNPQADTMWQHARMFGYDRNKELVRVYMPGNVAHLFTEINAINNAIFAQIRKSPKLEDIKVFYPKGINPTRKNVLDKEKVGTIVGGVNYFPNDVSNNDLSKLDAFLEEFTEQPYYEVHPKMLVNLLGLIDSKDSNWDRDLFISFIESLESRQPDTKVALIVRKDRSITKGTGTLLSPNDRKLGDTLSDRIVCTLYKMTGDKGWGGNKVWVPNIKFPAGLVFYNVEE
jgi:hypothetical protein